jgi:uncharacterized protein (TIGR04255 family)
MAEPRRLRNPPVTEAVVDIHVEFSNVIDGESFKRIHEQIRSEYPEERFIHDFELSVEIGPQAQMTDTRKGLALSGYMYVSGDTKQVVQVKKEGLTFSRLAPYGTWEETIGETMRLWKIYLQLFAPSKVTRVSTRFINKLLLPGVPVDFDDYLTISPKTPEHMPPVVARFLTMLSMPVAERTAAQIRCSFEGQSEAGSLPVILDLDIIRECACAADDAAAILEQINELRPIKNSVFFGSLKDRAVELYV